MLFWWKKSSNILHFNTDAGYNDNEATLLQCHAFLCIHRLVIPESINNRPLNLPGLCVLGKQGTNSVSLHQETGHEALTPIIAIFLSSKLS